MMRFLQAGFILAFISAFASVGFSQSNTKGFASTYPLAMEGATTASGELYVSTEFTACHATLPFNTLVKVTNLKNKKSVTVRINDRFAYRNSRVIDVSNAAADAINLFADITPQVSVEVIGVADALMLASVKQKQEAATKVTAAVNTPAEKQDGTAATAPATVQAQAAAAGAAVEGKKENPSLLSNIKLTLPTISAEDIGKVATLSFKYLSMGVFRH